MTDSARAIIFHGPGQPLELRQGVIPEPRAHEIRVRILACTLCGSDLHTFEGRRKVALPTVLGHEILGRIEAFGPDAPRFDLTGNPLGIGDRVTWSIVASCGHCVCCARDLPQKCTTMLKYGHEQFRPGCEWTGGLADFCLLARGSCIVRLPDDLPDSVACPANCATATVSAAIEAAGNLAGRTVLVAGAGMLGLTACAMARSHGASEVVCFDTNHARLNRAAAFGATRLAFPTDVAETVSAATGRRGVDVALELTGAPDAFDLALGNLDLGGRLILVGAVFPTRPVVLQMEDVIRRHLTLTGVHNYAPRHLFQAVTFLTQHRQYPFASLVAEVLPLAEAERAFELARDPAHLRVCVTSQQASTRIAQLDVQN